MNAEQIFKKQQQERKKEVDDQVAKCKPVFYEILKSLCELQPSIATESQEETNEQYGPVVVATLTALKDAGLTMYEVDFTLNALKNVTSVLMNRVQVSLNKSDELVLKKTFGKDYREMTLAEWDAILTAK